MITEHIGTSERIDTTIGELIEAVTQIALEAGRNESEGYRLASLALGRILLRAGHDLEQWPQQ